MSFEDYVHHMTKKYRLATAIGVLKSKPTTLSVEQYIAVLKNKINEEKMNTNDLDFSLGSDDFNFDDDDDDMINDGDDVMINDDKAERESLNDNVTILKDVNMEFESNDNVGHELNSFENVMNLLKEVDGNAKTASKTVTLTDNMTQRTFCESSQTQSIALTLETNATCLDVEMPDLNNSNTRIDETQDFIFIGNRSANTVKNNLSEIAKSEEKLIDDSCDFKDNVQNDRLKRKIAQTVFNNLSKEANESLRTKTDNADVNNKPINTFDTVNKTLISSQSTEQYENIFSESQIVVTNHDMVNKVCQNLEKMNQTAFDDSQSTVVYSLPGYTQNFTHVSQSQYDIVQVADSFIHGRSKSNEEHRNSTETHFSSNLCNFDEDIFNILDNDAEEHNQMYGNRDITYVPQIINVDSSEIQYVIDRNGRTYRVLEGFKNMDNSINSNTTMNTNTKVHDETESNKENIASQDVFATNDTLSQKNESLVETNETTKINESKVSKEKQNSQRTQDLDKIFDEDLTASQKEVIPFKVIEELNKIKTFLTRKVDRRASTDGFSTDSGYRSDSQSKSSFKNALQLTGNAVNQSAHSLYTYLLQCPLVGTTEDITQEIATVLGKLVDKLHETEKYPSFLEDILDSIDSILKDISEGENFGDSVIMTKDESIQRLLLLNKSSNVIKYTIEKITNLLEKFHTFLTNEDNLYEITDIDATENACYIFHILEILIKRYRKTKIEGSSQNSTQNSKESEGILKKSSITDIWRKKWNPEHKIVKNEGSFDKKCVLTKCGEVLNKVIVDCMEGYSLVSFAALQCFNLLQS